MRHAFEQFFAVIGIFASVGALIIHYAYRKCPYNERHERGEYAYAGWEFLFWGIVVFGGMIAFGVIVALLRLI